MILRCCWRGLSPALLATPEGVNSSRSCSCQLSNSINKKVDGPHRGCTYGPNGLCRLSQGLSNYENNIHKQRGIVKQHKFRHFRKQKSDLQIASRCTSINRNVRKGRSPPWWPCALNNKLLSAVRPLTWVGLYFSGNRHCLAAAKHPSPVMAMKMSFSSIRVSPEVIS